MYNDKELQFYDKYGVARPEHEGHGEDSFEHPQSANLLAMSGSNWRQQGNKLICDTENGQLVQLISTDLIMTGVDSKGFPILKNIYKN